MEKEVSKEKDMIRFIFEQHNRLSCIFRFNNVPRLAPQSVAEHSYRVAFLSMLIADDLIDRGMLVDKLRLLEMGMLHDIEEIVSGDIIKILKQGRFKKELDKLNEQNASGITCLLGTRGDEYFALWKEAKDGRTLEAKVIGFCDMVDRIVYCLKEAHLGNNYLRELLEFEAKRLHDWISVLPQLTSFIEELSKYALMYLKGDPEILEGINKAVRVYDYKVTE